MSSIGRVSISKAAKMAGVSRSTFYRHVEEKGISLQDKDTNRPMVDLSELVRVYGDKLRIPKINPGAPLQDNISEEKHEIQMLQEKLRHSEELRQTEKAAAAEQIELLKKMLDSEKSERKTATLLLTDQRGEKERQAEKITTLEKELTSIKSLGFFARLFSFK